MNACGTCDSFICEYTHILLCECDLFIRKYTHILLCDVRRGYDSLVHECTHTHCHTNVCWGYDAFIREYTHVPRLIAMGKGVYGNM